MKADNKKVELLTFACIMGSVCTFTAMISMAAVAPGFIDSAKNKLEAVGRAKHEELIKKNGTEKEQKKAKSEKAKLEKKKKKELQKKAKKIYESREKESGKTKPAVSVASPVMKETDFKVSKTVESVSSAGIQQSADDDTYKESGSMFRGVQF